MCRYFRYDYGCFCFYLVFEEYCESGLPRQKKCIIGDRTCIIYRFDQERLCPGCLEDNAEARRGVKMKYPATSDPIWIPDRHTATWGKGKSAQAEHDAVMLLARMTPRWPVPLNAQRDMCQKHVAQDIAIFAQRDSEAKARIAKEEKEKREREERGEAHPPWSLGPPPPFYTVKQPQQPYPQLGPYPALRETGPSEQPQLSLHERQQLQQEQLREQQQQQMDAQMARRQQEVKLQIKLFHDTVRRLPPKSQPKGW